MSTVEDAGGVPSFPSIGRMARASQVTRSLNTTRAIIDPGYSFAVVYNYSRNKLSRGRSKLQLHAKLERLELKMPHFANDFRSVRRQLELLPSRVLPNGEIGPPPPPYSSKRGCSCHCTCGADEHAAAHAPGAPETPELPELRELRELREFNELQVLHEVLAGPVGPGPAPEYPFPGAGASTSSSMSSMSTLNVLSSSASSDALNMHLAPRGPRTRPVSLAGLRPYPRFRVGSSASASSVNLATVV